LPELAPSLALVGFGLAFLDVPDDCSSGVDALSERLRYSLPVMSESGAPIYSSDSKSMLRYSQKHKVGRLDERLLAEAFSASWLLLCLFWGLLPSPCQHQRGMG